MRKVSHQEDVTASMATEGALGPGCWPLLALAFICGTEEAGSLGSPLRALMCCCVSSAVRVGLLSPPSLSPSSPSTAHGYSRHSTSGAAGKAEHDAGAAAWK